MTSESGSVKHCNKWQSQVSHLQEERRSDIRGKLRVHTLLVGACVEASQCMNNLTNEQDYAKGSLVK